MATNFFELTVKELVESIEQRRYFLPSIQREFVWGTDRIEKLFDSLMRGFPIGSFLFWQVPSNKVDDFQFYEFIRNYHALNNRHNTVANLNGNIVPFQAILDGQQRMTSLYIGLKGSFAEKLKYLKKNNVNAYPEKKLYLNLLSKQNNPDIDLEYNFKFLTDDEAKLRNNSTFWFEVGKILGNQFKNPVAGMMQYVSDNNLISNPIAGEILSTLHQKISTDTSIGYYLEKNEELDKVVNIFIRVNSGGMVLSPSDLLLSFATAQLHGKRDVREEIYKFVDLINDIGGRGNFAFDKDFVLKAFLVICDEIDSIKFKASNFNKQNMEKIDKNWDKLTTAIISAIRLIDAYGFNKENFSSNNSLIPIAHYMYEKQNNQPISDEDEKSMIHWFIATTLTGAFGSSTDSVLNRFRTIIKTNHDSFPLQEMIKNKDISADGIVEDILDMQYKDKSILMALSILYPNVDLKNKFHIDHIFPQSKFNAKNLKNSGVDENFYKENLNSLANLQLLEGKLNQSKSDQYFDVWLNKTYTDESKREKYMDENCIPKIDLSFGNFKEFVEKRENLLRQKLKENLKNWNIFN